MHWQLLTKDRPWLGEFYQVAVYDRALTQQEAMSRFKAGNQASPQNALVFYNFCEGIGQIIKDRSNKLDPLNLRIESSSAIEWLPVGGLVVRSPVLIASPGPATKISNSVRKSNAITIEAWIKPSNTTQAGPARIVTVSKDPGQRNFNLGQKALIRELKSSVSSSFLPSRKLLEGLH